MAEKEYLHVRVKTQAKKESVYMKKGKFFIEVKEKAEKGYANKRVKELLVEQLGCSSKELRLLKGATTPSKTYLIVNS